MCYCEKSEKELFSDLKGGTVPDEALLRPCCWKKICQVRGKWFKEIGDLVWTMLCDKRVELIRQRQQPSGTA